MGIYESLTRNNNLLPVAQALREMVQKKRQDESLKNFITLMQQKKNEINNLYQAPDETQYNTTPISSPMKDKILGKTPQTGMNLKVPDNLSLPPEVPNTQFDLGNIGKVESKTIPGTLTPEMIAGADRKANDLITDTMIEGYRQKLAPEQIGQTVSMMERLKQNNKPYSPKVDYHTVGDGGLLVGTDEKGNIISKLENPKENKNDPKYMWHKIGEGIKSGKEYAIEENIATGERREVELGEKRQTGTTVNVNTEPDVATLVGEISETARNIKSGKLNQEQSNFAYSELEGKTEELVDRYGLKGATNLIWQRINKGKSVQEAINDVDRYQQQKKLEPFDPREKDYLNLYFNARITK